MIFIKYALRLEIAKNERLGQISYSKFGSRMKIIKYEGCHNVTVEFDNGYSIVTQYSHFIDGEVKYPYDKSVCNVGYFGEGDYKGSTNNKTNINYNQWDNMLHRCYDDKYQKDKPTYIGCTVNPLWHNFQTFAQWHSENYYTIEGQRMCLDKDILYKGNKIYSPETCIIVPEKINALFIKNNAMRGNLPIGVFILKSKKAYQVKCNDRNNKVQTFGKYDTPESAFESYKSYKEHVIRETAEYYKFCIPKKLYEAMIAYRVEITD